VCGGTTDLAGDGGGSRARGLVILSLGSVRQKRRISLMKSTFMAAKQHFFASCKISFMAFGRKTNFSFF
jgi:hypothetical protein